MNNIHENSKLWDSKWSKKCLTRTEFVAKGKKTVARKIFLFLFLDLFFSETNKIYSTILQTLDNTLTTRYSLLYLVNFWNRENSAYLIFRHWTAKVFHPRVWKFEMWTEPNDYWDFPQHRFVPLLETSRTTLSLCVYRSDGPRYIISRVGKLAWTVGVAKLGELHHR